MVLVIKGISGPYQNRFFKVAAGMGLGRRQGDILLEEDNTVSSLHGRVISLPNGQLLLKDAGSQNQFLVSGRRVDSVVLTEGTVFQVGQCVFQVLKINEKDAKNYSLERNWKEIAFEAFGNNRGIKVPGAGSLSPAVRVDCVQGASADISWYLGFGPRLFGPLCEDIEILEKDSADVSFQIVQGNGGPQVKALSQNVLINKRNIPEKLLEDGDEIQVGSSIFKIRLGS